MIRANRSLNIEARYLPIALLPLLIFVGGDWFLDHFGNYAVEIKVGDFDAAAEAGGRYVYYGTYFLFVVVCLSVFSIFLIELRRLFNLESQRRLLYMVAGLGSAVFIVIVISPIISHSPKAYWFAGRQLFDELFANAKIPASCQYEGSELDGNLAINPSTCVQLVPMRLVFIWLSKIANVLVALAAGSAIAGAISCLATPPRQPEGTSALAKDQLQRLNQYVYLGAALMVSGMISMLSWLHWPDFYVSGNTKDSYSSLVSGLTIYFGINYSLIIFAYYAPVALILAQRAAEPTTPARPAKATATPGTLNGVSASETLKVIFALLSPFLTGLLGTLINMLSKGLGGQ